MIETKKLVELYPNAVEEFRQITGFPIEAIAYLGFEVYTDYFDNKGLFIGITCDADGIFWIPEVCSIPLHVSQSRIEAQDIAIEECFKMVENMTDFAVK